jgi:hypothetical protein
MTVVSFELKRQGQNKPHNSKMIRQYNGKNKAIRQTMDHGKLKIEHSEPTKTEVWSVPDGCALFTPLVLLMHKVMWYAIKPEEKASTK